MTCNRCGPEPHVVQEVTGAGVKSATSTTWCVSEAHVGSPPAEKEDPSGALRQIQKDLAEIKASIFDTDGFNFVACPVSYGGSSGSGGRGQSVAAPEASATAPSGEQLPPVALDDPSLQIPWQIGDGRGEAQHQVPVTLSDAVRGSLENEP